MNRIMDAVKAHPSVLAGLLAAALLAGVAVALSTQPLVPPGSGAGSAGSAPAAGSARAASPTVDGTDPDAAGDPGNVKENEQPGEGPTDGKEPQAGSPAGEGAAGPDGAEAPKPGKPSSGGSAGGAAQKPAAGGGQAQKPQTGGGQTQRPSSPKPSHNHSWQAVYRDEPVYSQQWVSKWEDVFLGIQVCWECSACGARFYDDASIDNHVWGTYGDDKHPEGASAIDQSYEVWEKRDNGSYQTVQTGTKRVLDHYECACGARK